MRRKKQKNFKILKPFLTAVLMIACICTSTKIAVYKLTPYVTSGIILDVKPDKQGEYTEVLRESKGVFGILGKFTDIILGGNFAAEDIAKAVSGNMAADIEKPTIIDDAPKPSDTPPKAQQEDVLEKNIDAKGGKLKIDGSISINNETSYSVDAAALLENTPAFTISAPPQVLIVHSHATESYNPGDMDYTHTSVDRSTDTRYNMVAIGNIMANELKKNGVSVTHLQNLYDYPEYNNSYSRSCKDVESEIAKNPGINIVIDLHRDAITTKDGQRTKVVTEINGEKVAQVMLVVGTDELGLKHDNWRTNLKFAADLQKQFMAIDPNFPRPVNLRTSRFNGHTAPGAVIVEVGAAANTMLEAQNAAKYVAQAIVQLTKIYSK